MTKHDSNSKKKKEEKKLYPLDSAKLNFFRRTLLLVKTNQ